MNIVNTEKNKALLWNILYENKVFDGIANNQLNNIKMLFEKEIIDYNNRLIANGNIDIDKMIIYNKEILKSLSLQIKNYKTDIQLQGLNTKDEFLNQKNYDFHKNFELKKNIMDKELNPKKPNEIEFNEKMDEPINGNEMNNMLESLLKSRNIIEVKREENKEENIKENIEENVPKIKISNIEELLDENLIIDINNSNSNIVLDKEYENNLDKNSEFIKIKNFNKILNEEYKDENNYNLNYKLNSINKMLKDLLNNQNLIMKKLNILEEKEENKKENSL